MSKYTHKTENTAGKRRSMSAWKREDRTPVALCKGVEIDESVYDISENRYFTLILKGIIVYFITAGGIGAYLTAIDIDFNQVIFNIVVFATAIVCAILYHSWKSENLGYLVFFAFYAAVMVIFKDYINSGFYAVINDTIDWASIYFKTDGLQYYNERISNRNASITISMSIIGVAINVLLNNYILRRARYMVAIFIGITVNIFAFYMLREPDTIYSIMLLAGIVMTFVLKSGRHFYLSRRDHIFEKSRKGLTYALDYKVLWQIMLVVSLFVLVVVAAMSTVYDKVYYDYEQTESEEKKITSDTFQNFIMLGIFGLIDFYPNNGGLATGTLGGVSAIRLDNMPDLRLIYTPYTTDTVYIKNFSGTTYLPVDNKWIADSKSDENPDNSSYPKEVEALKNSYEEGDEYSARAVMTVTNIEAPQLPYQPYYSKGDRLPIVVRQSKTYEFYPRFNETTAVTEDYTPDKKYLHVDKKNKKIIDKFIDEAGISGDTPEEVAESIRKYFDENIPYTLRPGATPWRQDFVNYFLTENQKGYCAHFASAGTLILREMGIPARYCEGYAVSFNQVTDRGELLEDSSYDNYYSGYNPLGETAPVRVDATDADAHAWIEMYVEGKGWVIVELTPSSGLDEEDDGTNFWDAFNNFFGDGEESDAPREENDLNTFSISGADRIMRIGAYIVIVLFVLGIIVYIGIKVYPEIKYAYDYKRAGRSDKLILKYSRYIRKLRKKNPGLGSKMNYTEQMNYLIPSDEERQQKMTDILERAGFSNKEIDSQEYLYADEIIEKIYSQWKVKKKTPKDAHLNK